MAAEGIIISSLGTKLKLYIKKKYMSLLSYLNDRFSSPFLRRICFQTERRTYLFTPEKCGARCHGLTLAPKQAQPLAGRPQPTGTAALWTRGAPGAKGSVEDSRSSRHTEAAGMPRCAPWLSQALGRGGSSFRASWHLPCQGHLPMPAKGFIMF